MMKIPMHNLILGKIGERKAIRYLRKHGYVILTTNYRTPLGEIDIIAREENTLVFIEVKTRSNDGYGLPQEAVDRRKQHRLIRMAHAFLNDRGDQGMTCRFDVVAVLIGAAGRTREIELIRDAFVESSE